MSTRLSSELGKVKAARKRSEASPQLNPCQYKLALPHPSTAIMGYGNNLQFFYLIFIQCCLCLNNTDPLMPKPPYKPFWTWLFQNKQEAVMCCQSLIGKLPAGPEKLMITKLVVDLTKLWKASTSVSVTMNSWPPSSLWFLISEKLWSCVSWVNVCPFETSSELRAIIAGMFSFF